MTATLVPVPGEPMSLDKVIETYPVLRQSLLAEYDDCALYSYFGLRYEQGWGTHPSGRGTLFHRFAAECLREMQLISEEQLPESITLAVLEDVLKQADIPPAERVRVPLREIPVLRMASVKFAKDNAFTIANLIDVEKILLVPIEYVDDQGQIRERMLRGTPDAIVLDRDRPEDGIIVLDWKDTWALPPERNHEKDAQKNPRWAKKDAAVQNLSYHGYFQQRFYAYLLLKTYPKINYITLREFYARRSKARPATVTRDDLPVIEEEIQNLVREFDRSLCAGKPKKLTITGTADWRPTPGKHCFWCTGYHHCPLDREVLKRYAIKTPEDARENVEALEVLEARRKIRREAGRTWAEENGPVESRSSKGGRAFGLKTTKSGPELTFFTPEGSDMAPRRKASDKDLEDAMKQAIAEKKDGKVSE